MSKRQKKWTKMTSAELREATKLYDQEFAADKQARPLTSGQRKMHQEARKRGRPTVGKGAARVLISVERGLLQQADAYAGRHRISRSEMIATGLRGLIFNND